jgi:ADP-ribosylation factor-like protein 6
MGCRLANLKGIELPTLKMVVFGLHGAGKSSILNRITHDEFVRCLPTLGVSTVSVEYNEILKLVIFDVSGHARSLWNAYFESVDTIIFVVDCSDERNVDAAKDELHRVDSSIRNVHSKPELR